MGMKYFLLYRTVGMYDKSASSPGLSRQLFILFTQRASFINLDPFSCMSPLRLGKRRYNIKLWKTFTDCFNCLPVAAIVDEKIFCCHGGLSPDLQSMEQIRRIMRPTDVPDQGLLCDLLWSDPDKV